MTTDNSHRITPDKGHAAGMLRALVAGHTCGTACTGTAYIGGEPRALQCPYSLLDMDNPADRRTVQTLYASEARAAMGRG